jgi:hypothetical protein
MPATASVSVAHDRVQRGALESFSPFERFQIQAIGIEKGKPFSPDAASFSLTTAWTAASIGEYLPVKYWEWRLAGLGKLSD